MTLLDKRPDEMMRATAGFERHRAGRQIGGEGHQTIASNALAQHHLAVLVEPGQAANRLAQIDTKSDNRHWSGPSSLGLISPVSYRSHGRGGP